MFVGPEGLTGFFLLFQGSKGDPGMTGPTGAAGLPVSLMGSEVLFTHPCPPPETLSNGIPRACSKKKPRAKREFSCLWRRKLPTADWLVHRNIAARRCSSALLGDQVLSRVDRLMGCSKHTMSPVHCKPLCLMQGGSHRWMCHGPGPQEGQNQIQITIMQGKGQLSQGMAS